MTMRVTSLDALMIMQATIKLNDMEQNRKTEHTDNGWTYLVFRLWGLAGWQQCATDNVYDPACRCA